MKMNHRIKEISVEENRDRHQLTTGGGLQKTLTVPNILSYVRIAAKTYAIPD